MSSPTTNPTQKYFDADKIKILNKLHRLPAWANSKDRANTDRSLMTAKVHKYILELGDHITSTISTREHSKAWDFVATRSASKLNSQSLQQLYVDIVAEGTQNEKGSGQKKN